MSDTSVDTSSVVATNTGGRKKCIHGCREYYCKPCGGKGICEHQRVRASCKECGGSAMCGHGGRQYYCKECEGAGRCKHGIRRSTCRECDGSEICTHSCRRTQCKECMGASICEHNTQRARCRDCDGSSFCKHSIRRSTCVVCTPSVGCQNCRLSLVDPRSRWAPNCFQCHCALNPFDDIPHRPRTKEAAVVGRLRLTFPDLTMICDKKVADGCSRRRPDLLVDFGSHVVIVECDEFQHRNTSCEDKRMMELFQDCNNRPIVFLRFNPDSFMRDGQRQPACFKKTSGWVVDPVVFESRMAVLETLMRDLIDNIPDREVTIEYLFYDDTEQEDSSLTESHLSV